MAKRIITKSDETRRFKKQKFIAFVLSKLLPFVISGVVIYLILIGEYLCPFKIIFKIPCLGCGMTRAYKALLRLDFKTALKMHALFPLPALWAIYLFFKSLFFKGKIGLSKKIETIAAVITLVLFCIYWAIRLLTSDYAFLT